MSQFESKYKSVLSFRKSLREEKRAEYLKAKALVDECFDNIESKNKSIVAARKRNEQVVVESHNNSAKELSQNSQFIKNQYLVIKKLRDDSRLLIQQADKAYQVFVEQQKEFKIIEKLIEKEKSAFKAQILKKEINLMSDMQIIRAKRKAS